MRHWGVMSTEAPTVDNIQVADEVKAQILELLAWHLWRVKVRLGTEDGSCKSYDPLHVDLEEKEAHTYVFDLWDGGRHHPYESLQQLEQGLEDNTVEEIQEWHEEER